MTCKHLNLHLIKTNTRKVDAVTRTYECMDCGHTHSLVEIDWARLKLLQRYKRYHENLLRADSLQDAVRYYYIKKERL